MLDYDLDDDGVNEMSEPTPIEVDRGHQRRSTMGAIPATMMQSTAPIHLMMMGALLTSAALKKEFLTGLSTI